MRRRASSAAAMTRAREAASSDLLSALEIAVATSSVNAAMRVSASWGSGSLLISAHYESLRYDDRANLTVLEPYFLLNATVNQHLTKNLTMFASLRNILDESYESFYRYTMPGITLTLGLRAKLELK